MSKTVFFDIDGTIWDDDMVIPESTLEAVAALKANGHLAFICTGRARASVRSEKLLNMPVVLEGSTDYWIDDEGFEDDPYVDYLFESLGEHAHIIRGYNGEIRINKFSADVIDGTDYERVKTEFADDFLILEHVENVVEFVPKGTSKATGIKWLCNHLDIPLDETYAIGDSVNDLEMLESVGHGIAMGNSMPPAKEIAEYVTSDISDDGVKNALKHYGLI